jgi:CRP-like cAMP-binding protein
MYDIKHALGFNKLFKDFNNKELINFLVNTQYQIKDYSAGQVIALEGDPLTKIGLILDGNAEIQKSLPSGKKIIINQLTTGDIFGEVIIFSNKKTFPSMIVAVHNTKIIFFDKINIMKICFQNEKFLRNLLQLLSEKILILDYHLRFLTGETIRQKICLYLLEQYQEQKNLCIHLTDTRETLAKQFGVTRPSLSRELHRMKREGLINLYKNIITISNLSLIEQNL